jgi:hypothetical protein
MRRGILFPNNLTIVDLSKNVSAFGMRATAWVPFAWYKSQGYMGSQTSRRYVRPKHKANFVWRRWRMKQETPTVYVASVMGTSQKI